MKLIKLLTITACAFALVTGSAMAQDSEKKDKKLKGQIVAGSCCDKKQKANETCSHPCCVSAAKEGKVCEKCNKLKGEIVAGSCCDKKQKANEVCSHPCCVSAAKEGKVCEKCNKPEAKKEEAKS